MLSNHLTIIIVASILFAIAYFWGVASFQHYLPGTGIYIGFFVASITALGTLFFSLKKRQFDNTISTSALLWCIFLSLLTIQPFINHIVYRDDLIFPVIGILLAILMALVVGSFTEDHKKNAVHIMAIAILCAGIFTVFTQFAQLMQWDFLVGKILFRTGGGRLIGNIAQVNQAVFVTSLAIASIFYFIYQPLFKFKKTIYYFFAILILFWLGMGVGFSASRGGILLAIGAVITPALFYQASFKQRILYPVLFSPAIILGYVFGTGLMNQLLQSDMTAVGRMVGENTLYLRKNLLEQAWLAFSNSPITGQGWGNLQKFGLDHANELAWLTTANHAHNFIAQIAAELGILGLLILAGFAYVLIKHLRFNHKPHLAFAYAILMLMGMYSVSEYPMWHLRFLILTVFFIAIIDSSTIRLPQKLNLRPIIMSMSIIIFTASSYYIVKYNDYIDMAYTLYSDKSYEEKIAKYEQLPYVFGFSKYRDLTRYTLWTVDETNVYQQVELGERLFSEYLIIPLMTKQANMYAVVNRVEDADQMYINACRLGYIKDFVEDQCDSVIATLQANAKENPEYYQGYLDRFTVWYEKTYQTKLPDMLE